MKLVGVVKFVWNKKEKENEEGFRFGVLWYWVEVIEGRVVEMRDREK